MVTGRPERDGSLFTRLGPGLVGYVQMHFFAPVGATGGQANNPRINTFADNSPAKWGPKVITHRHTYNKQSGARDVTSHLRHTCRAPLRCKNRMIKYKI